MAAERCRSDRGVQCGGGPFACRCLVRHRRELSEQAARSMGRPSGRHNRRLTLSRRSPSTAGAPRSGARSALWMGYVDLGPASGNDWLSTRAVLLFHRTPPISRHVRSRQLAGKPLCRALVCVRSSRAGALAMDARGSPARLCDVAILGELRQDRQPKWSRAARLAGAHDDGAASA